MSAARNELLGRLIDEVAHNGLSGRSLRDLAESVGSSHRMLLYHFGSRAGLVAAIVASVEQSQRDLLEELGASVGRSDDLMLALWRRVSSEELRPFVRLFFECVAVTGGRGLTDPWLATGAEVSRLGVEAEPAMLRLGVAVTRGLLIDVLATGDAAAATESYERFVAMWRSPDPD